MKKVKLVCTNNVIVEFNEVDGMDMCKLMNEIEKDEGVKILEIWIDGVKGRIKKLEY